MIHCNKCSSSNFVKNGKQFNEQRYKCKDCGAVFQKTKDKYSSEFKLECIKMYLGSMSIRAIAKIKNVHNSVVSYWIKKMAKVIQKILSNKISNINIEKEDIAVLEVDELCTYIKKNLKHQNQDGESISLYGLLWTETKTKLLILK